MTSKLHQRLPTVVAAIGIIVLLAVIIVLWVQVGHGAFRTKYNITTKHVTDEEEEEYVLTSDTTRMEHRKVAGKVFIERTHLDDGARSADIEFVKPLKISPLPLHDHDILYEQLRQRHNATAAAVALDAPPIRHHSGHFRHKQADIWDPHPEYEIVAFGHKLHLVLAVNERFVSPTLQVQHVWKNYTRRVNTHPRTAGCYYTGKVKGEDNSDVAVSLCNGMTGYIRAKEGNFHIEPVETFQSNSRQSLLHRIQKTSGHKHRPESNEIDGGDRGEPCGIKDNTAPEDVHQVVEDDFQIPTTTTAMQNDSTAHRIYKRDAGHSFFNHRTIYESYTNREKRTHNQEYFIETMVVADKKMVLYHKTEDDLIHYILTLMSHVALLYKDATIGNPISLAVVRIVVLKDVEFYKDTSEGMLREFCKWQYLNNYDSRQAGHHDTALLLTRENICRNSTTVNCNTLGVAEVGTMCSASSSCAIVRDNGLSTSYTIAHELGHVLNMPHDGDSKCRPIHGQGRKSDNIMSSILQNDTKPWLWSACSKHFLTEFLDSSNAKCLLDQPDNDLVTHVFASIFPGETFEVDRQCELEYGKGSKVCSFMRPCALLWCSEVSGERGGCKTRYMPWAEGTACGDNEWCHHGECIALDRRLLSPVAGDWGPWQAWGACTRTCGGGVKLSHRACDSPRPANGGLYCTGPKVRYTSCGTQPCKVGSIDFREEQCAAFDGNPPNIKGLTHDIKWLPKYGADSSDEYCKLYCRVQHSRAYYKLAEKVVDGTKCGLHSFDVCVNGICRRGGCDNKLDSNMTLDDCGVCGGDNSKCEEITGRYNVTFYGYNRVVRFPKGSSNIEVRQSGFRNTSNDDTYLALVDGLTGEYILNGKSIVSTFPKDIIYGGITIKYSGSQEIVEHLNTTRRLKLNKDLILEVISVGRVNPPDITYKYTMNRDAAPRYGWQLYDEQWSKCSSICNGTQYLQPMCVELASGGRVSANRCSEQDMHGSQKTKECNVHCKLTWTVVSRGHCSSHCGMGHRFMHHKCLRVAVVNGVESHGTDETVDEKHCSVLPKPSDYESCSGSCDTTRWDYDPWTPCTQSCGGGRQTRNAKCVDDKNSEVAESHCDKTIKHVEQACNDKDCPRWSLGEWSPCSVTCGSGYKKAAVYCTLDGQIHPPAMCDEKQQPSSEKECEERSCVQWTTSDWSSCSVTCGDGLQSRTVHCQMARAKISDVHCQDMLKPNGTRHCPKDKCAPIDPYAYIKTNDVYDNSLTPPLYHRRNFEWRTGPWSECSKSCDGGTMLRRVACQNVFGSIQSDHMCQSKRPIHRIVCNTQRCPKWRWGEWTPCDDDCLKRRQVSCQAANGRIVPSEQCSAPVKPSTAVECTTTDRCAQPNRTVERKYKWKIGRWGPCSNACGKGRRSRAVSCVDVVNAVTLVDQFCDHLKKPKDVRNCMRTSSCNFTWVEGSWSQCSKPCGEGYMNRTVTCHQVLAGGYTEAAPLAAPSFANATQRNYCNPTTKPNASETCKIKNCDDEFSWFAGPWKECSHECGKKGRQIRNLFCYHRDGKKVQRRLCPRPLKPHRKRKCNQRRCTMRSCKEVQRALRSTQSREYVLTVGNRTANVYCHRMETNEPLEFISLPEEDNYAELYDKRLNNISSCPGDGYRKDNCDCTLVPQNRSGFTVFWKVRLNVTSLRIVGNDFTFSRQIKKERQVPYGTAGDCYSESNCPQGRFSIDLTKTSFKLSPNVRWNDVGSNAYSQINKKDTVASGKCGGYCGKCVPDPLYGLSVEVS